MWLTPLSAECAQALSPREAALRLARLPGLAWLDGGLEHGREGRFSFVSAAPVAVRTVAAGAPAPFRLLDGLAPAETGREARAHEPARITDARGLRPADVPCWVGHIAYEAGLPRRLLRGGVPGSPPGLRFARYDAWFAFDHRERRGYLVGDDAASCARLRERLHAPPLSEHELAFRAGALAATPLAEHERAIRAALALIREGEIYEINLARRLHAPFADSALGLFLRLRALSPVPLGYFVAGEDHAVLGRSMERFLRYDATDRSLRCSPIKGTVARAGDDAGEATRLRGDPKEQAEHAMVVDLMRNDLSRVCEVGSVEVSELMAVLPFAGLSHLVSTVTGRVCAGLLPSELLARTFPPGSVTGAPKERVLAAIAELEHSPRGVYTGCVGFVDRAGGCSFAVAIRTAVVAAGAVEYWAGGGIVADSDPQRESEETELKAAFFRRALSASASR